MKFSEVRYSCGHYGYAELPIDEEEREARLVFYSTKARCPDCYAKIAAKRDNRKAIGCIRIKMDAGEYSKNYSDCQYTRVGIENDDQRIVFVPKERVAAEAVLKILGVKYNNPKYERMYRIAVDDYILRDTSNARRKLLYADNISDCQKERISTAFDVIEKYQESVSKQ